MKAVALNNTTYKFLRDLKKNNNRPWFNEHKDRYTTAHENVLEFTEELITLMNKYDQLVPRSPKQTLFRIYRDTRFSKDKTPYKNHFSGGFKRDTKWLRGGYYFHLEPGNNFVAGGFWGPNSADLQRIRQEIAADDQPLRKILASKSFKDTFGTLIGDQVKTAPKGYPRDHPSIDLLRFKQLIVRHDFTNKQAMEPGFAKEMVKVFRKMRPYFDYMSEVLTTDSNGVPIE
ncbi:MAG: DUF2461 domain-containing protein [Bacteroidota bacterium]